MTSIIINSFYRALLKIDEHIGIKNMSVKDLTHMLVDELYPEDGYITVDDSPRTNKKHIWVQLGAKTMNEVMETWKDATETTEDNVMLEKTEATIPVAEPAPAEVKVAEPKKKLTKEEKAAEKAAKEKAKADKEAENAAKAAAKEKAKADKEAAKKPKFVGNVEKLNPTQEKTWKKLATEEGVDLTEKQKRFLAEINAMDNKLFKAKKFEEHVTEFLAKKEEPKVKDEEMVQVTFKDKEYFVNREGVVYQADESGVDKKVGNVGMLEFRFMPKPTPEDFE